MPLITPRRETEQFGLARTSKPVSKVGGRNSAPRKCLGENCLCPSSCTPRFRKTQGALDPKWFARQRPYQTLLPGSKHCAPRNAGKTKSALAPEGEPRADYTGHKPGEIQGFDRKPDLRRTIMDPLGLLFPGRSGVISNSTRWAFFEGLRLPVRLDR